MPGEVRAKMETSFGADFSGVRVHEGSQAASIGARAYTQGADLHFAPGEYQPGSQSGQELIGHELAHVVQQGQGRVQATKQAKGVAVNDDFGLEREADEMGARAARGESASGGSDAAPAASSGSASGVAQRKIGEERNIIYGLSGRNLEAIRTAVDAGYTTFDAADTYGNTIELLATAAKEAGKAREDFEVIYKVAGTEPKDLMAHLLQVASLFNGFLDQVLIHKVEEVERTKQYEPILLELKQANVVRKIGGGDVKPDMVEHLAEKDSFEINAAELLLGDNAATLADALNKAQKPVFVYNVVRTLQRLLGTEGRPTHAQIAALVGIIQNKVPAAEPILSSSSPESIKDNRTIDGGAFDDEMGEAFKLIQAGVKRENSREVVPIEAMDGNVRERVGTFLITREWAAETLFEDKAQYAIERAKAESLFTPEELDVRYAYNAKTYSLKTLIGMLYDSTGNCERITAFEAFMKI